MLDTVKKQHQPYRLNQVRSAVPRLIPKAGASQARTFYYKVVRNTKSCTKVLGAFVIEPSSEYTVGVPQTHLFG